jgi:hypothetical protein
VPQKGKGFNMNPMVVAHHILWNKGGWIKFGSMMGFIGKRISLILSKPLPPTLILISLVFITRFMVSHKSLFHTALR